MASLAHSLVRGMQRKYREVVERGEGKDRGVKVSSRTAQLQGEERNKIRTEDRK